MKIDFIVAYGVITLINILWTGGLYISITAQLGQIYDLMTGEDVDE